MNLTENQHCVLEQLRKHGRESLFRYEVSSPCLFSLDCDKVRSGDKACVFGMGDLSWRVGRRIGLSAARVLAIFKQLERKGLVIRETDNPTYKRPLYWWPVGLAAELAGEIQ